MVLAFGMQAAWAANGEKLLLGFEDAEIAKMKSGKRDKHASIPKTVSGKSTEGKASALFDASRKKHGAFRPGAYNPVSNNRAAWQSKRDILSSWAWFDAIMPKDWSGFDCLRADVMSESSDMRIRMAIEDDNVDPPVQRTFKVPGGKWATLELDLNAAVKDRGLDPKAMVNIWFYLEELSKPSKIYFDNIRLSKNGAASKHKILKDPAPYKLDLPRAYQRTIKKKSAAPLKTINEVPKLSPPYSGEKDTSPIKNKGIIEIAIPKAAKRVGFEKNVGISAYDNKNMMISFFSYKVAMSIQVITTTDGCKTWKNLEGTANDTTMVTGRGPAISGGGCTAEGDLLMLSNLGCCGYGFPADRIYFRRVVFNGKGWEMSNMFFVDSDIRHCSGGPTTIRLKSGRIWGAWGHYGRYGITGVNLKYSDDNGVKWHPWHGKEDHVSTLPTSLDDKFKKPYGRAVYLSRYGEHVACIWGTNKGTAATIFDGKAWSKPQVISKNPAKSAVTLGDKDIFVLAEKYSKGEICHYNGSSWSKEKVSGLGKGKLAVSGKKVYIVGLKHKISGNYSKKNMSYEILCWERKGSSWAGPKVLAKTKTAVAGYMVQPYAPENFVPVVWSCLQDDKGGYKPPTEKKMYLLLMPTK